MPTRREVLVGSAALAGGAFVAGALFGAVRPRDFRSRASGGYIPMDGNAIIQGPPTIVDSAPPRTAVPVRTVIPGRVATVPPVEAKSGALIVTKEDFTSLKGDTLSRLSAFQSSTLQPIYFPKVHAWRSIIEQVSREYNVPVNIAATLMHLESEGNPDAVSPAGARGLWQVMPGTFPERIKSIRNAKEREAKMLDPYENGKAAMEYYRNICLPQAVAYANKLGIGPSDARTVGLAIVGYNHGAGNIGKAESRLPEETKALRDGAYRMFLAAEAAAGLQGKMTEQQIRQELCKRGYQFKGNC